MATLPYDGMRPFSSVSPRNASIRSSTRLATLDGWEAYDAHGKQANVSENWVVKDGVIQGSGPVSHLFSPRGDYENFRYRAEVKAKNFQTDPSAAGSGRNYAGFAGLTPSWHQQIG